MADAHLIVEIRRLGNDLRDFKTSLRKTYPKPSQQVTSIELRERASSLAEAWLADLSQRLELTAQIPGEYLSDLNVHFQRILVSAEHATVRRRYDAEVTAALRYYTTQLVVPLMQGNQHPAPAAADAVRAPRGNKPKTDAFEPRAFVGHSFADGDTPLVNTVIEVLRALGIQVETGLKPKADRISDKVKTLIDEQHIFVGIFTRRDKLEGKELWNTSAWVIDEKAYAYGRNKKLILLKEEDVQSIGGIQGDYEFLEFSRNGFHNAILGLIQLFSVSVRGLRE